MRRKSAKDCSGLNQGGSNGDSKKWWGSGNILTAMPTGLVLMVWMWDVRQKERTPLTGLNHPATLAEISAG